MKYVLYLLLGLQVAYLQAMQDLRQPIGLRFNPYVVVYRRHTAPAVLSTIEPEVALAPRVPVRSTSERFIKTTQKKCTWIIVKVIFECLCRFPKDNYIDEE